MKINVVFPYNIWAGGTRSTFELCNNMTARGHDVVIYIPFIPYRQGMSIFSREGAYAFFRGLARSAIRRGNIPWFETNFPVKIVPWITDRFIRDADIVMANHWPTAYSVAALSPSKGQKFHMIRDSEPWKGQETQVTRSYRLPLTKIVTLPWLKDMIEEGVGVPVRGIVTNGTNVELFRADNKQYHADPVIVMMHREGDPRKGMADGFKALSAVLERFPKVKVQVFGWDKPTDMTIPATFHLRPIGERLRQLYAESDILLCPSLQEGYHNPPREAMAAQCAVVATNVGCIPHCAIAGETALVVEPGDVDGMIENLSWLIESPERIPALAQKGYEHIKKFTWEQSTTDLLEIFEHPEI